MTYAIQAGLQLSLNYNPSNQSGTWYRLTDHNRKEIEVNQMLIEKDARMANGILRKYVIDTKVTLSTSWEFIPSKSSLVVDYTQSNNTVSAAWMTEFYNANAFIPVWVKVIASRDGAASIGQVPSDSSYKSSLHIDGDNIYRMYMTKFSTTVEKRTNETDFVNMTLELTEI